MERKSVEKRNLAVIAGMITGILMPSWLNDRNGAENLKRVEEAEKLRMAVSTLFQERTSKGEDEVMDFCTKMYWLDIGDKAHPLFGFCPSSWECKGRITGMIVTDDGELKEIVYQGLDGTEEVWTMSLENGHLEVEVEYSE